MMWRYLSLLIMVIFLTAFTQAEDDENPDFVMFSKIFTDWTKAFNQKDLTASCGLFSQFVKANYQGVPEKNYYTICDGFKKIFNEKRHYQYDFKLHDIYRSGDLAAVRITWYLKVLENNKIVYEVTDEGLDVFQQDHYGNWKIINYLGYPVKAE